MSFASFTGKLVFNATEVLYGIDGYGLVVGCTATMAVNAEKSKPVTFLEAASVVFLELLLGLGFNHLASGVRSVE